MNNIIEYENLIAFHPSLYVEDLIEELNLTHKEFSKKLGISDKVFNDFINAKTNLSPDLAYRLESLTGISYGTWINLQNKYDKIILEIDNLK